LIDLGRGDGQAAHHLRTLSHGSRLAVSTISYLELIVGCANKAELRALERFLKPFIVIKLDERISDGATELLRRYRLSHKVITLYLV
jgi:predicted nucleic acid-binding protein